MIVTETVLGNIEDDPELATKYEARPRSEIERVVLDDRDRRRSRIRTTTDAGTEIGIVVDSDHDLRPGDVLVDDDRMIVITFDSREALTISLDETDLSPETLVELTEFGYQVGNRHWDLAVRDEEIVVAVGTDGERKVREVEAALPSNARTRREMVDPTLFDGTREDGDGADSNDGHTHRSEGHAIDEGGHTHEHDGSHSHAHSTGDRTGSTDETRESE